MQSNLRIFASVTAFVAVAVAGASCSSSNGSSNGASNFGGSAGSAASGGSKATGGTATGGSFFGGSGGSSSGGAPTGGQGGSSGSSASGGFGGTTGGSSGSFGFGAMGGSAGAGATDATFTYDAPSTTQDACAAETSAAERIPLDIYVMYDQSLSMSCAASGTTSRWAVITPAFQQFLNSPQAAGIGVGIQYFGLNTGSCNAADYFNPDVPIAPLPGNYGALANSLGAHGPSDLTPTPAAMIGARDQAISWKQAHLSHVVVVLLVTDGQPNLCGTVQDVANTAASGFNGNPSIRTFVLGIVAGSGSCIFDPNPPNVADLDAVAQAGGTNAAYVVDPNSNNAATQLLNALDAIRGSATLPCQYAIPKPSGGLPDTSQVTVTYTPGTGGAQVLTKVTDQSACSGAGWYFDNNTTPTAIILCQTSCDAATTDLNAHVDVTIGCIRG